MYAGASGGFRLKKKQAAAHERGSLVSIKEGNMARNSQERCGGGGGEKVTDNQYLFIFKVGPKGTGPA